LSRQEITELVEGCRALGWSTKTVANGYAQITPPEGDIIIAPARATGRALGNFKADLRRAGYNPEKAEAAKAEKAANALLEDRKKNDAALERAERRATEAATAVAKATTVTSSPFMPPEIDGSTNPEAAVTHKLLAGYPYTVVAMTIQGARELLERGQCKQRHLYQTNAAKFQQAMELNEWELNPVDSLVTDEHGCLINGQHRMHALANADPEFIATFYKDGVPFYLTTGFPSALAHIFDTGKARSSSDALAVGGLEGWNTLASSALRLVLNYDQSFQIGGVEQWPLWRSVQYTNTELVAAASGEYQRVLAHSYTARRAYSRAGLTRSATMVAAFLMERDNPDGGKPMEMFWNGVCGDDGTEAGDPRMALVRYAMRASGKVGNNANGTVTLSHVLRRYADWQLDRRVEVSSSPKDIPMVPVWRPGMKWYGTTLRYPKFQQSE
jgi:hypothetical protein